MDNSPTTGSVNTTTEEKQRLAKSSLAFNCKKYVHLLFSPLSDLRITQRVLTSSMNL